MKKKDLIIGLSLVIILGVSGVVSLLFIINQTEQTEDIRGLPDNWDTAPNSAYFILKNNTTSIKVTLESILEGIKLAIEDDQDHADINAYKDVIHYYPFYHQTLDSYIAGVDLLDILEKYNINFAYNITIQSFGGENVSIISADIIKKMYEGVEDPLVIAIAADEKWLAESSLGEEFGNFSLIGKNWNIESKNIKQIEITSNWIVNVEVNTITEFIIDPSNMTKNEFTANYSYDRSDFWNYDRQYWGRNISEIISHTNASGKNYSVRFYAADGVISPPYNQTDIELGIVPPFSKEEDYINKTLSNPSGVPMFASHLLMNLVYKDRELGETNPNTGVTDPVWPYGKYCGYHRGPFYVVIPGRPRAVYIKYVYKISISYS